MDNKQADREFAFERWLFFIMRAVLALVLFPIVTLLVVMALTEILVATGLFKNHDEGSTVFVTIAGAIAGLGTALGIAWKPGVISRRIPSLARLGLREPFASCLKYGFAGAMLFGGPLLAIILLLGHTRPIGWDLDRIPLLMAIGFAAFSLVGLQIGLEKKRRQKP